MPSRKPRPTAGQFPLSLTEKQRQALIETTRLKEVVKERLKDASRGTRSIRFTERELYQIADEAYIAIGFASESDQRILYAVFRRVNKVLDDVEDKDAQDQRELPPRTASIYQFKVTLKGSKPPIWRRFQMADGTLGQLHHVLQRVMGWTNSHLHQFIIRGESYGSQFDNDLDFGMDQLDEEDILISEVAASSGKVKFGYEYDFGDDWQHEVVLEKVLDPERDAQYPRCIAGARACPPEDCGGIWGYADFIQAMADPNHESHDDVKQWYPGPFDPETFSIEAINRRLKGL